MIDRLPLLLDDSAAGRAPIDTSPLADPLVPAFVFSLFEQQYCRLPARRPSHTARLTVELIAFDSLSESFRGIPGISGLTLRAVNKLGDNGPMLH